MRALELYAGIGGFSAAIGERAEVAAAIEQSDVALKAYRFNHPHPTIERNLNGVTAEALADWHADLWWLSPPCQSFTLRGRRQDIEDSRAESFLRLIGIIEQVRPAHLALENVVGFFGSRAHQELRAMLARASYQVRERTLCPTELGLLNRRKRCYLVASRSEIAADWPEAFPRAWRPLSAYLEPDPDGALARGLAVPQRTLREYAWAMQIVEPSAVRDELLTCFTSAYGRSPVRSGPYLRTEEGARYFSPREILRFLDFPETYAMPPDLPLRKAWALLGNSLSVIAVKEILRILPRH